MKKTSVELAAEAEALRSEMLGLAEIDEPTEEQATRAAACLSEFEAKDAERAEALAYETRVAAVRNAPLDRTEPGSFAAPNVVLKRDPFENLEGLARMSTEALHTTDDLRERAITAISETKQRGVSDRDVEAAIRTIEEVDGAAAYALAHGSRAYMSGFRKFVRHQGQNVRYSPEELRALDDAESIRTALNITTGQSGAYSLPTLFDPSLIKTGAAARNPIRSIARVETGTQNVWHGVSTGNITAYWSAEAAAQTDGAPTLAAPVVTAGKLAAFVPMSYEFYEDSSVVAQLPALIGEAFDYKESTAFVSGTGTDSPKGVITAISATAGSTVTATTRGASSFTSASTADVWAVVNAVEPRYEDTSSWIGNKKTFNIIRQMSPNGVGSSFWGDFSEGIASRRQLAGSPAYNSSDVVATQTTGTVILVLGDFSQYLVYDRIGIQVEFVQNVVDSGGLPTMSRALLAHKRVGGNVLDINAFRFLLN